MAKKTAKAPRPVKKPFLLNWPPSRGPMPSWMRAKPRYKIPNPNVTMLPEGAAGVELPGANLRELRAIRSAEKKDRAKWYKKFRSKTGVVIKVGTRLTRTPRPDVIDLWLSHSVEDVAGLTMEQASSLVQGAATSANGRLVSILPERALTVDLSYPLSRVARVRIEPYQRTPRGGGRATKYMDVGYLLWQIARVYKDIYRSHKRWDVWGHAIGDLVFEHLVVRGGRADVAIGS